MSENPANPWSSGAPPDVGRNFIRGLPNYCLLPLRGGWPTCTLSTDSLDYLALGNQPNIPVNNRFGYWVQSLRKAKGKTQREVAAAAGIDFTYLSKLEHGKDPAPSEDLIARLAQVLEVPAEYLQAAAGKIPSQVRRRVDQNPRFALLLKRLAESDDSALDRYYRLAGVKDLKPPSPEPEPASGLLDRKRRPVRRSK